MMESADLRRTVPIQRSATPFCHGLRYAVLAGRMPSDSNIERTCALKVAWRSKTRWCGAVSYGNAPRSCWTSQAQLAWCQRITVSGFTRTSTNLVLRHSEDVGGKLLEHAV